MYRGQSSATQCASPCEPYNCHAVLYAPLCPTCVDKEAVCALHFMQTCKTESTYLRACPKGTLAAILCAHSHCVRTPRKPPRTCPRVSAWPSGALAAASSPTNSSRHEHTADASSASPTACRRRDTHCETMLSQTCKFRPCSAAYTSPTQSAAHRYSLFVCPCSNLAQKPCSAQKSR